MADQTLVQPFLAKPTTKDSGSGIFLRIFSVLLVGAISLWANHEASKGFSITIINEAKESPPGKRFSLFFESDDTAVRLLLETSFFVERFLYDGVPRRLRKPVNHVTVRFNGNRSDKFSVASNASNGEYVIGLSSSLMKTSEFRDAVEAALRRSMVKVWLWGDNDESGASPELVAGWLDYCERRSEGYIRRLNHGMRLGWDDQTVDLASNGACGSRQDALRELKKVKMTMDLMIETRT
ncbi:uncharacterized protein LOC106377415 [Brassica napus]|uniref:uncharacterized protein LOC106377415 n=1 Tax=Brassica napus TaxID=3708 RepID=UPI0006AAC0DD|nr:uncharacterized protein LOC106377415 [Brassica napus]